MASNFAILILFLMILQAHLHAVVGVSGLECDGSLVVPIWKYQAAKDAVTAPNFYTFVKMQLLGGSTSNFNGIRNGGKLPLITGVQKFLNLRVDFDLVQIPHSFTVVKAPEQKDSIMELHLIVLHNTLKDANQSASLFECAIATQYNHTYLHDLNSFILHEMSDYKSYQNVTVLSVDTINHVIIDTPALVSVTIMSGLIALGCVMYLTLKEGTNLELFIINQGKLYKCVTQLCFVSLAL